MGGGGDWLNFYVVWKRTESEDISEAAQIIFIFNLRFECWWKVKQLCCANYQNFKQISFPVQRCLSGQGNVIWTNKFCLSSVQMSKIGIGSFTLWSQLYFPWTKDLSICCLNIIWNVSEKKSQKCVFEHISVHPRAELFPRKWKHWTLPVILHCNKLSKV